MPSYCAFLGHQPHLSLAELCIVLPDFTLQKQWSPRIITFETKQEINEQWLESIGGTVLIAKELQTSSRIQDKKTSLEEIIPPLLHGELKGVKRKAIFSFRCFSVPRSEIRSLYRLCKDFLKNKNLSSRYIGNERHPAKPGTLLLRGIPGSQTCELVVLRDPAKKKRWIGKTCAVQDIEAYTDRDMGKPFRDTKTGLMPPKLAQILLNFALLSLPHRLHESQAPAKNKRENVWEKITVWDPFCGTGVIALEALHRRAHVLASDKIERAVKGCKENIQWLRRKEKTPKAITFDVWKHNATKSCKLSRVPSVIVTESSLGPALTKPPTKKDVTKMIRDAEKLELDFFTNMSSLVPDAPIVCMFPTYITRDGTKHFLPKILDKIQKLGYRMTCVSNKGIRTTDRSTLLYLRPDQHVGREVAIFLPPKK